jgi:hypothetical protein
VALGNDVNLRDFEGRSALLLGKAKDNNGACAIGPFIRVFDEQLRHRRRAPRRDRAGGAGAEGFVLHGSSSMAKISRDPLELVRHAMGKYHQYPDGMMLFCGTMFAPIQDRINWKRAGNSALRAAREMVMVPVSSGSRSASRAERANSGNSSRNNTPWCALEISPGRGGEPLVNKTLVEKIVHAI